jgi:FdrA protein
VGAILLDVVLGHGAHPDPAGHLAGILAGRNGGPLVIASVTGTDADPQPRGAQVEKLVAAGVVVADSNAEAAALAVTAVGRGVR